MNKEQVSALADDLERATIQTITSNNEQVYYREVFFRFSPRMRDELVAYLRQTLSAQEPGTVVVPVEPTGAMLVAGSEAGDIGMGPLKRAYAAMLSAAPKGSGPTPRLQDHEFSTLLQLFIASDPWPLATGHATLDRLLDAESQARGFSNWVEAYHRFPQIE